MRFIKEWTSGNPDINKFIKEIIYNAKNVKYSEFLKWVHFDRFIDVKEIGEDEFAKVYSATWMDGPLVIVWKNKMMKVEKKSDKPSDTSRVKFWSQLSQSSDPF